MLRQRRRWFTGTKQSSDLLPHLYQLFLSFRMVAWALSPVISVLSLLLFLFPQYVPQPTMYQAGSIVAFSMLFVITLIGAVVYIRHERLTLLAVPLTPLLVVLNTAGAFWGWLSPVRTFAVTEKVAPKSEHVPPKKLEQVNPWLKDGDLENHDGKETLVRGGDQNK